MGQLKKTSDTYSRIYAVVRRIPSGRVINSRGEISRRSDPGPEPLQRLMLEDEGVVFDEHGRVDLKRFRWEPA